MVESSGKVTSGQIKNLALAGLDRGLILSGHLVAQRATRRAPIETGRLKRSITSGRPYSVSKLRVIDVGTNVEYAKILEVGGQTPPHEIVPRFKKALAFTVGSEDVVVKRVQHPGSRIPAQPYLRPALAESKQEIRTLIVRSVIGSINS
jgi:phage gpG-like protein